MTVQNQQDIDGILQTGRIVALVRDQMLNAIEPGMTTAELDELGAALLNKYEARSAPQVTYGFPGATCISVNEEAAHGIPGPRVIKAGDIVNVDVSAEKDGYFADTGGTTVVPPGSPIKTRLCHATQVALERAMSEATADAPINRIGKAIQRTAKAHGFKLIKNLGLGQVIAIEPFLSTRSTFVTEGEDGWTLTGHPHSRSAQFEHTIIVTKGAPIVATRSAA